MSILARRPFEPARRKSSMLSSEYRVLLKCYSRSVCVSQGNVDGRNVTIAFIPASMDKRAKSGEEDDAQRKAACCRKLENERV